MLIYYQLKMFAEVEVVCAGFSSYRIWFSWSVLLCLFSVFLSFLFFNLFVRMSCRFVKRQCLSCPTEQFPPTTTDRTGVPPTAGASLDSLRRHREPKLPRSAPPDTSSSWRRFSSPLCLSFTITSGENQILTLKTPFRLIFDLSEKESTVSVPGQTLLQHLYLCFFFVTKVVDNVWWGLFPRCKQLRGVLTTLKTLICGSAALLKHQ